VVIGVGNAYRGDDEAGLAVAQRLRATLHGADVLETDGEPTRLLDAWDGATLAIVVDAVHSHEAPAGFVHRFDIGPEGLQTVSPSSSHGMGPGEAVELGRALGRLPERLIVYGIEGHDFGEGAPMAPEVLTAIDEVVERIQREVDVTRADPGTATA
jgi:hydrogenase maturation protease